MSKLGAILLTLGVVVGITFYVYAIHPVQHFNNDLKGWNQNYVMTAKVLEEAIGNSILQTNKERGLGIVGYEAEWSWGYESRILPLETRPVVKVVTTIHLESGRRVQTAKWEHLIYVDSAFDRAVKAHPEGFGNEQLLEANWPVLTSYKNDETCNAMGTCGTAF